MSSIIRVYYRREKNIEEVWSFGRGTEVAPDSFCYERSWLMAQRLRVELHLTPLQLGMTFGRSKSWAIRKIQNGEFGDFIRDERSIWVPLSGYLAYLERHRIKTVIDKGNGSGKRERMN